MELIWIEGDDSFRPGQSPYAHARLDRPLKRASVVTDPAQIGQQQTIALSDQPDLSLAELVERAFAP